VSVAIDAIKYAGHSIIKEGQMRMRQNEWGIGLG
jgi:hypothetical protein